MLWFQFHCAFIATSGCFRNPRPVKPLPMNDPFARTPPTPRESLGCRCRWSLIDTLITQILQFHEAISAAFGGGDLLIMPDHRVDRLHQTLFQRNIYKWYDPDTEPYTEWPECFWCFLAGFGSSAAGLVPQSETTKPNVPAGEASFTSTFVQTWCSKAYMAETMAASHAANTPLSSRCEVKGAKLINTLEADRVS